MRWKVCHSENQRSVGGGILLSSLFFSVFTHTSHCLWCFLEAVLIEDLLLEIVPFWPEKSAVNVVPPPI